MDCPLLVDCKRVSGINCVGRDFSCCEFYKNLVEEKESLLKKLKGE